MNRRSGFTLIEVLVALAIAAMGLAAVLSVVTNAARDSTYLREKTFATWIALNQLTTVRIGTTMPSVDRTDGDVAFANGKWKWQQTVTQTEVPGMRRVDVAVRHAEDPDTSPLATVTGFVGRTQVQSQQSSASWEYAQGAAPGQPGGVTPGTPGTGSVVVPTTPPGIPPQVPPATTTALTGGSQQ